MAVEDRRAALTDMLLRYGRTATVSTFPFDDDGINLYRSAENEVPPYANKSVLVLLRDLGYVDQAPTNSIFSTIISITDKGMKFIETGEE